MKERMCVKKCHGKESYRFLGDLCKDRREEESDKCLKHSIYYTREHI